MKLQTLVLILGINFFFGLSVKSEAQLSSLEKADSLFDNHEYTGAYQIYDSLFFDGSATESMLLKMALINEGLGDYPKALYFLTIFQELSSSDEGEKKIQELAKVHDLSGYNYGDLVYVRKIFFENFEFIISIIFLLTLGIAFKQAWNFYKRKEKNISGMLMTIFLGIVLILFINFKNTQNLTGVFMAPMGYLMEGPSAGSSVLGKIKSGEKIVIKGEIDTWLKVEYEGGIGYIRTNQAWLLD